MPNALTITLAGVDITTNVDMTTVVMQLAGSQETATCEFDIIDTANSISATDEATLTVTEVSSATVLFGGFVRSRRITIIATGRIIHILATDYNSLLDRAIVVSDKRVAGESDKARLTYLMTTYGPQFSSDYTKITTLNASMVAQKFLALTLRQAIERVLGQASTKSSYFVDPTGRLNTYDRTAVTAAPFNVRVGTPSGGELAPDEFSVDNDASNLANAIYIVGATTAGSGWFTDTTSISTYGRRERFFNAPDADTAAKASQLGLAVLADQKNPIPRGAFTTSSPNDGWRIGQSITITSTQHGLAGVSYRIARVTVHYLSGAGDREYSIEVGAPQVSMPALLAAAHGGGGGFPWHSPGGTGGWGPVVGSGTTGGGVSGSGDCACNTPVNCNLVVNDTFTRTLSGSVGTSDSGKVWTGANALGAVLGVNGSRMYQTNATSSPYYGIAASIGGLGSIPAITGTVDVQFDHQPTGAGVTENSTATIVFGGTSNATATISTPGPNNITPVISLTYQGSPDGYQELVYNSSLSLQHVRFYIDSSVARLRVWTGSVEPSTWQLQVAAPSGASPIVEYVQLVLKLAAASTSQNTIYWDNLNVLNCPDPNSGQPYPKTFLRKGDGFTTSFQTLTAYRPGSLLVYVDNVLKTPLTPSATDPTNRNFALGFAPTSSESVSASWVVE